MIKDYLVAANRGHSFVLKFKKYSNSNNTMYVVGQKFVKFYGNIIVKLVLLTKIVVRIEKM